MRFGRRCRLSAFGRRLPWLGCALAFACAPGNPTPATVAPPSSKTPAPLVCSPDQATPTALAKAGTLGDGTALLANGRMLTPVGTRIATGRYPLGLAVNADETRAYVVHTGGDVADTLMVLDLVQNTALQSVPMSSSFRGVALAADGKELFAAGGSSGSVHFFAVAADGRLTADGDLALGGYVSDLAVAPGGATLFAVANTSSIVSVIDLATRKVTSTMKAGTVPYDLLPSPDGATLWVSNIASSTVQALDLATGKAVASIATPKDPESMALSPDGKRLYVACADADAVAVIDTATRTLSTTFDLSQDPKKRKHGSVNGIAVSPDGARLYVSEAGFDRVDVVDAATGATLGAIPTGWYPTAVATGTKGVFVLSMKGFGSQNGLKALPGFLQVVPFPDDVALATMTAQVVENNTRGAGYFTAPCSADQVPALTGKTGPIQHVVLIVRENKTYDMDLGDFERGDGDPDLVVFGKDITPNLHKLATEFVNFDNYYANAENSQQGHLWTTQASCGDFVEKGYLDQLVVPGFEPASLTDGRTSIFDTCFANGVGFRSYGELPNMAPYIFDEYFQYFDDKYPFWDQNIKDVDKAAEVLREVGLGILEPFTYIVLPNDHTYGGKAGKPTPETQVADNDRATAMLVEGISQSTYWPNTVIFIIEDDPQGSGDHVEGHRSICVAVSPWVRRAITTSVHYDIPSLYRTIEMILGLPAMGKNDELAAPMLDIWVDGDVEKPDFTPFTGVPVNVIDAVNPKSSVLGTMTAGCDFDEMDECPGLGAALWYAKHGDVPVPPYAKGIDR